MSIYQQLAAVSSEYISKHKLFKHGFNLSPMFRRSTARIVEVSRDLKHIQIKLPISYKNRNYVNSIFGGSMFAAVDPIPMVQLMNLLGDSYVVWDKAAQIKFRRPAREDLYARFEYSNEELEQIQLGVEQGNELEIEKTTQLTNANGTVVFCEVVKTIYVADKAFYKAKRKRQKT